MQVYASYRYIGALIERQVEAALSSVRAQLQCAEFIISLEACMYTPQGLLVELRYLVPTTVPLMSMSSIDSQPPRLLQGHEFSSSQQVSRQLAPQHAWAWAAERSAIHQGLVNYRHCHTS